MAIASCCQEYRDQGLQVNGTYFIHPDKNLKPFEGKLHVNQREKAWAASIRNSEKVECKFSGAIGSTIISHYHSVEQTITSEIGTLDGCSEPGCFSDNITYNASPEQIEAVVYLAKDCYQEINFECSYNRLTGYSWWTGRDGSENTYWHGNSSQQDGCACFENDSCDR